MSAKFLYRVGALVFLWVFFADGCQALVSQPNNNINIINNRYLLVLRTVEFKYYIDKDTIKLVKDPYGIEEMAEVWIQVVATRLGSESTYAERLSKGLSAVGYENYSYSMQKYLVKFDKRKVQKTYYVDFDNKGGILDSAQYTYDTKRWEEVIPSTVGEKWYNAAKDLLLKNADVPLNGQSGN